MELELARAILNEAISGEFLDTMPETEEEILEQGQYFAEQAQKEYNSGWGKSNETVVAIVNLLPSEEPANSPSQAQPDSGVGSGSSAFFRGLPLPQANESEPIQMPFDVSSLSDSDIRKYHGIFNHYFSRVRYELAEENSQLVAAEHLRDEAFRQAYSRLDKDGKTLKALETEAMARPEYISWNNNVLDHEKNVIKLKALSEIYAKNVEVLSREATIRQNEYERSR